MKAGIYDGFVVYCKYAKLVLKNNIPALNKQLAELRKLLNQALVEVEPYVVVGENATDDTIAALYDLIDYTSSAGNIKNICKTVAMYSDEVQRLDDIAAGTFGKLKAIYSQISKVKAATPSEVKKQLKNISLDSWKSSGTDSKTIAIIAFGVIGALLAFMLIKE